jgi:hypothetical protein
MVMISSESIFCWELKKRLKIWSFGLVMMEEWRNTGKMLDLFLFLCIINTRTWHLLALGICGQPKGEIQLISDTLANAGF